jgi:hypothetical protein
MQVWSNQGERCLSALNFRHGRLKDLSEKGEQSVVSSRRPTPADVPVGPHQNIRLLRALASDGKQPIHFRTCLGPHRHGRRSMPRRRPGAGHDHRGAAVAPLGALILPPILNRGALDTDRTEARMSEDRRLLGEFHESGNRAAVECQERSNVRNVWAKSRIWSLTSTASSDRCAPCAGKRTACDQCGKSRRRGSGRATRRIGHQRDVLAKIHVSSEMVAHPCSA